MKEPSIEEKAKAYDEAQINLEFEKYIEEQKQRAKKLIQR